MASLIAQGLAFLGETLVKQIPGVGPILDLGLQLGVWDWLGALLVHILTQRFGLGTDLSVKLIKTIGLCIVKTDQQIQGGTLITPQDKQAFASQCLEAALKGDPEFKDVKDFSSIGALLIELIYQLKKLETSK
jgi:hypothetical protein